MSKVGKIQKEVQNKLEKGCACYVLISCSEPNAEGKMEVEMQYDGDEVLAAFLVDNASQMFEDRFQNKESESLS